MGRLAPTEGLDLAMAETVELVSQLNGYLGWVHAADDQSEAAHECNRITLRLVAVMAWLLSRQARQCGEPVADRGLFGADQAALRLADDTSEDAAVIGLAALSRRSSRLFRTVADLAEGRDLP